MMFQFNQTRFWANNFLKTPLKERVAVKLSPWGMALKQNPWWICLCSFPVLQRKTIRLITWLYVFSSRITSICRTTPSHAVTETLAYWLQNRSEGFQNAVISAAMLLISMGSIYSYKPHIALSDQLEKNAQYHLNHLKWDFSSQIYMAKSKVEHWQLFCKLGLYRQPKLDDSACHNSTVAFYFSRCSKIKSLIFS